MENILLGLVILVLLGLWLWMLRRFAPACPFCYAHLERTDEVRPIVKLGNWQIIWAKFACPECWYMHWYIGWRQDIAVSRSGKKG